MTKFPKLKWGNNLILWVVVGAAALLTQCSSEPTFQKSPLDELIKAKNDVQNFSIVLYDMDYDEEASKYKHQYQVLTHPTTNPDTLIGEVGKWVFVPASLFKKHQEDMGMEIVSKTDGMVKKQTSPAGYSSYVGNEKYGHWDRRSNGSSFWAFYGQYAFMSSMFRMSMYPVRYSYWNDYRGNYYNSGRSYYGSNGQRSYGTNSKYSQSANKSSRWNSRPSDFKRRVRSKVQRSSSTRSKRSSRSSSRTSRSSSRYSSGSSYRSRGGGFGK